MSGIWPVVRIDSGKVGPLVGNVTAPSYAAAISKAWGLFGPDSMPVSRGDCDQLTEHDRRLLHIEREVVKFEREFKIRGSI
jgi:hypothetical protein